METTDGHLLGGRVRYRQPAAGHRTGIEPVLLAAAVPARPGESVLEGGTGAAAGLLCLNARVPGLHGTGLEMDPGMAALARDNLADNGVPDWPVLVGDILVGDVPRGDVPRREVPTGGVRVGDVPLCGVLSHLPSRSFDHAFANPPWHDPAGTPSPDARRRLARQVQGAGLAGWAQVLAGSVRAGGSVTLILPERLGADGLRVLADAGCGAGVLVPLWPKRGRAARIVLVQARQGCRGPGRTAAGLVLHDDDGRYTAEAEAIFRLGAALLI